MKNLKMMVSYEKTHRTDTHCQIIFRYNKKDLHVITRNRAIYFKEKNPNENNLRIIYLDM